MNREQIARNDFPSAPDGYDQPSVDAHLEAAAALVAALEAQVKALQIECDAVRRQLETAPRDTLSAPQARPLAASDKPADEAKREAPPAASKGDGSTHSDEEVSARLVATQLALDGADRERIRAKLDGSFDLKNVDSLIDDVLARLA
jgi:cell division septum initiation protein DivIVA